MNSLLDYSPSSARPVFIDDVTYAPVKLNSSTANNVPTGAFNRAVAPKSYTFVTTYDQYQKIFSGQCLRVNSYIHGQLDNVSRSNDDENEAIVDNIANVIDLVGEPAYCTAILEAAISKDNPLIFESLLLAIGTARHKETEAYRAAELGKYAQDPNYHVKRAAVRALGRMESDAAKRALRDISSQKVGELAHLAAALLR